MAAPSALRYAATADAYMRLWNWALDRKVSSPTILRAVGERIKARLDAGIDAALIVALPILARSEGGGEWAKRDPTILLRDGSTRKTAKDGHTRAAEDHARNFAARLDTFKLGPESTEVVRRYPEVAEYLERHGVTLHSDPPPSA